MRRIELILPMPHKTLGPNGRCHWAKKARLVKAHNELVFAAACNAVPETQFGKCVIDVKSYTPNQWDRDNLIAVLKSSIDQLCRMGFILNDRDVSFGTVESLYGSKKVVGERRVELTLTEL